MKSKSLLITSFLVASLVIGGSAQAHDDIDFPVGLVSGVFLGLALGHHDHHHSYRNRPDPHYQHRDYRRQESYGYPSRDRYGHNHDRRGSGRYDSGRRWH